ncbi:hypothetical protein ADICYQ_5820 [Cyclobacterium qasimii M12-11B]|uniref:Uncharacterized protein n=1 Tax=Cyclobacterium qasimii M12-11B TaxID=641524 RepID=S7V6S9_9BACT|nr:hypothetical protein ADICYQ_5820 [Cyclobacterium qasimii M12-11B]
MAYNLPESTLTLLKSGFFYVSGLGIYPTFSRDLGFKKTWENLPFEE